MSVKYPFHHLHIIEMKKRMGFCLLLYHSRKQIEQVVQIACGVHNLS